MGRPAPANLIGGVRHSIKALRGAGATRNVAARNFLEGPDAGYNGRRTGGHRALSNVSKYVGKPLAEHPRALATLVPGSTHYAVSQPQLEEEAFSSPNEGSTSSLQRNPQRKEPSHLSPLQEGQPFFKELESYQSHFEPLLKAEQQDAEDIFKERLGRWPKERLVAEGYTLENLSAFSPTRRKSSDEYTIYFVPPVGKTLGANLFTRGMLVTAVRNDESPLDYGNLDRGAAREGIVKYSGPDKVLVWFSKKSDDFQDVTTRWRLDVGFCDIGYFRTLEAINRLNYNPEEQEAQSVPGQEVILRGTYLRKELLQSRGLPHIAGDIEPIIGNSSGVPDNPSGAFLYGAFAREICDWAKRYSMLNPEKKPGDPEIPLNPTQVQAIARMLREKVSLVQGPPGTGKTRTIIEAVRLLKTHFNVEEPLLICTYTNVAVDNLVEGLAASGLKPLRIGFEGKVEEKLEQWTIEAQLRKHSRWNELFSLRKEKEACDTARLKLKKVNPEQASQIATSSMTQFQRLETEFTRLKDKIMVVEKDMQYDIFHDADVVCTTCLSAGSPVMNSMDFPVVFFDEASMSTEPASLVPLMRGSKHLALIGDHKQLPPVITSKTAKVGGLSNSLFERLIEGKQFPSTMLNIQYRMHPVISDFPRREFYDSALTDGTVLPSGLIPPGLSPPKSRHLSARKRNLTDQVAPLLFIHHDHPEMARDRSKANIAEMRIVIAILEDLLWSNPEMKGSDIGVIAPYVAQIRMLNTMLKVDPDWEESFRSKLGEIRALQMKDVEVKTVDGFEGREKDVIIFSTVRNNSYGHIGFLADRRRMNVALTRARRALFVIGNMNTLSQARCGSSSDDISSETVEKNVAKWMVRGSGDEWKKYIQFVLLKNLFIEVDHPFEYRSKEEMLEFENASKGPLPLDYKNMLLS